MDEITFSITIYLVISFGIVSLAWIRSARKVISDDLLKRQFRSLSALILVAILFSLLLLTMGIQEVDGSFYRSVVSISLIALFALITRSALAARKIGEVYGFKVFDKKKK